MNETLSGREFYTFARQYTTWFVSFLEGETLHDSIVNGFSRSLHHRQPLMDKVIETSVYQGSLPSRLLCSKDTFFFGHDKDVNE